MKTIFILPLIFIGILYLPGCSATEDSDEIIDATSLVPKAEREYNYKQSEDTEPTLISDTIQTKLLAIDSTLVFGLENELENNHSKRLPDRLGFEKKYESFFHRNSIPYHIIIWEFSDSTKTINAFYNWIDCFGKSCISIRINEEKNGQKNPFAIWVTRKEIRFIESTTNFNYRNLSILLEETISKDYIFQIYQSKDGRFQWNKTP